MRAVHAAIQSLEKRLRDEIRKDLDPVASFGNAMIQTMGATLALMGGVATIWLVMCHGGNEAADELSSILGVDVLSTLRRAQLDPLTGHLLEGDW